MKNKAFLIGFLAVTIILCLTLGCFILFDAGEENTDAPVVAVLTPEPTVPISALTEAPIATETSAPTGEPVETPYPANPGFWETVTTERPELVRHYLSIGKYENPIVLPEENKAEGSLYAWFLIKKMILCTAIQHKDGQDKLIQDTAKVERLCQIIGESEAKYTGVREPKNEDRDPRAVLVVFMEEFDYEARFMSAGDYFWRIDISAIGEDEIEVAVYMSSDKGPSPRHIIKSREAVELLSGLCD